MGAVEVSHISPGNSQSTCWKPLIFTQYLKAFQISVSFSNIFFLAFAVHIKLICSFTTVLVVKTSLMRVDPVYRSIVNADFSHVEYHYQMVREQISSSQPIMVLKYAYTQTCTLNNSLPTLHGSFAKSNQTSIFCSPKTYPWLAVLVYSLLQRFYRMMVTSLQLLFDP